MLSAVGKATFCRLFAEKDAITLSKAYPGIPAAPLLPGILAVPLLGLGN